MMKDFIATVVTFCTVLAVFWGGVALLIAAIDTLASWGIPEPIMWAAVGATFVYAKPTKALHDLATNVYTKTQDIMWRKI